MVEDAIQDNAHAVTVRQVEQGVKISHTAQLGVDLVVIRGIVAVVGGGVKNGVEVDRVHPQVEDVVEALDDTPQVAALKSPGGWGRAPGLEVRRVVGGIAVGEAVGEDLVEDGILYPGGDAHEDLKVFKVWVCLAARH